MRIEQRDGKLFLRSLELWKGEGGWLMAKTADGKTAERIFVVLGADGQIQYLFAGGRAVARVTPGS